MDKLDKSTFWKMNNNKNGCPIPDPTKQGVHTQNQSNKTTDRDNCVHQRMVAKNLVWDFWRETGWKMQRQRQLVSTSRKPPLHPRHLRTFTPHIVNTCCQNQQFCQKDWHMSLRWSEMLECFHSAHGCELQSGRCLSSLLETLSSRGWKPRKKGFLGRNWTHDLGSVESPQSFPAEKFPYKISHLRDMWKLHREFSHPGYFVIQCRMMMTMIVKFNVDGRQIDIVASLASRFHPCPPARLSSSDFCFLKTVAAISAQTKLAIDHSECSKMTWFKIRSARVRRKVDLTLLETSWSPWSTA